MPIPAEEKEKWIAEAEEPYLDEGEFEGQFGVDHAMALYGQTSNFHRRTGCINQRGYLTTGRSVGCNRSATCSCRLGL